MSIANVTPKIPSNLLRIPMRGYELQEKGQGVPDEMCYESPCGVMRK